MKFKLEGIKELKKALEAHSKALGNAFAQASEDVADAFIKRNDVYVPLETGALRNSGQHFQEGKGWSTVTVIGYGFPTTETFYRPGRTEPQNPTLYALLQEEEFPDKRTPGTIMLYMETGFENYRTEAIDTITMELSKV